MATLRDVHGDDAWTAARLTEEQGEGAGVAWQELRRTGSLSVGVYRVAPGAADPQQPHGEDEVYVVLAGRGRLTGPQGAVDVRAGSVVVVPAGAEHAFVDVTEELVLAVVFAPPESG